MNNRIYKFALLILTSFHIINIFMWIQLDTWRLWGKASHVHIVLCAEMINKWENGCSVSSLFGSNGENPPFFYWVSIFLKKMYFNSYMGILLAPGFFLTVLIFFIYKIGVRLKNPEVGFLSALLCSFFAAIYYSSIEFKLELATAAMVSLIIYCLLAENVFCSFYYSVLLALSLGLGLLTRSFVLLFAIGPLGLVLIKDLEKFWANKKTRLKILTNILIIILLVFSITILFYIQKGFLNKEISKMFLAGRIEELNIFSLTHLCFYLNALSWQIGTSGFFLFLFSLYYNQGWENLFVNKLILSWIFIPLLFITLVRKRNLNTLWLICRLLHYIYQ